PLQPPPVLVDEAQRGRAEPPDPPAQRAADRPAGAGDQDPPAAQQAVPARLGENDLVPVQQGGERAGGRRGRGGRGRAAEPARREPAHGQARVRRASVRAVTTLSWSSAVSPGYSGSDSSSSATRSVTGSAPHSSSPRSCRSALSWFAGMKWTDVPTPASRISSPTASRSGTRTWYRCQAWVTPSRLRRWGRTTPGIPASASS